MTTKCAALEDTNRIIVTDRMFVVDVKDASFANHLFVRVAAKRQRFVKVDFKYSLFDTCYFRNCVFDSCDFTGCRFSGSSLHGSTFSGCTFDYSTFERSIVANDILDTGCPRAENLKMRFARTLRMNYQQLGDAESVNKAIGVELQATAVHLYKAWRSNERYYREKYKGCERIKMVEKWASFKTLDLIWGNGESYLKLLRATAVAMITIAVFDATLFRDPKGAGSFLA